MVYTRWHAFLSEHKGEHRTMKQLSSLYKKTCRKSTAKKKPGIRQTGRKTTSVKQTVRKKTQTSRRQSKQAIVLNADEYPDSPHVSKFLLTAKQVRVMKRGGKIEVTCFDTNYLDVSADPDANPPNVPIPPKKFFRNCYKFTFEKETGLRGWARWTIDGKLQPEEEPFEFESYADGTVGWRGPVLPVKHLNKLPHVMYKPYW